MEKVFDAILFLSRISPIVPICLFFYYRNYKDRIINLLLLLLAVSFLSDLIVYFLDIAKIQNVFVVNIYFVLQFIFVGFLYNHVYMNKIKSGLRFLFCFGLIFILGNGIFWQGIEQIQSLTWAVTSIIIVSMAFGHFSYLIKYPVIYIKRYPSYWISTGLLFYCCLSFLLFGFSKFLADQLDAENFRVVWMFHNLNNIFKNGCFFMAIWWAAHRSPQWDIADVHEN